MTTASRKYLKSIGITIPINATRFHADGGQIVFFVKDHKPRSQPYQGQWHEERAALTEDQIEALRRVGNYGSFGWELQ